MVVDECRPLADLNTNLRGGVAFVKEEPLKSTTLDEGQPLKEKLQGRLDSKQNEQNALSITRINGCCNTAQRVSKVIKNPAHGGVQQIAWRWIATSNELALACPFTDLA